MHSQTSGRFLSLLCLAIFLTLLSLAGCGKESTPKTVVNPKAFDTASETVKADWQKITTAADAKDYATAILTGRKLQSQGQLTPEQLDELNATITTVNSQMTTAAQAGNPEALKAVQTIRDHWRDR